MAEFRDSAERVGADRDRAELALAAAFAAAISDVRSRLGVAEVERLLSAGRLDQVMGAYEEALGRLVAAYQEAATASAAGTLAEIGRQLRRGAFLDSSREGLQAPLRAERDRIVRGIVAAQRDATLVAVARSVAANLTVRAQARAVRDSLGLTRAQLEAIARYGRLLRTGRSEALRRETDPELEEDLRDAVRRDEPVSASDADRMVDGYRRALAARGAAALALALAQSSSAIGREAALDQAAEDDLIDPSTVTDRWWTERDERVRGSHRRMHGQERPHGLPFRSGLGNLLRYPHDENAPLEDTAGCRCRVTSGASAGRSARVA